MILGIDTSNYTTSAAVLDGEGLTQQKQLLEVRPGERGCARATLCFSIHAICRCCLINCRQWMM